MRSSSLRNTRTHLLSSAALASSLQLRRRSANGLRKRASQVEIIEWERENFLINSVFLLTCRGLRELSSWLEIQVAVRVCSGESFLSPALARSNLLCSLRAVIRLSYLAQLPLLLTRRRCDTADTAAAAPRRVRFAGVRKTPTCSALFVVWSGEKEKRQINLPPASSLCGSERPARCAPLDDRWAPANKR